ncbi:MAG: site-specific integrase [Dermatophilaceae bacterium]
MARSKRTFGEIDKLPSGRYRARYTGPDRQRHSAPHTFDTKMDADAWLTLRRSEVLRDQWSPKQAARTLFGEYAKTWLTDRDLKPRTRAHYQALLDSQILPTFGNVPLKSVAPAMVRKWHNGLRADRPTLRSHAYGLLHAIMQTAMHDGETPANPVHIRSAGTAKRVVKIRPATLAELELIVASVPERYKLMVLLAAWCALRFGELIELRRPDVDLRNEVLRVQRGAVRAGGEVIVDTPKSEAGVRDVAIPPHLIPVVKKHLSAHVNGRNGLLFPAADGVSTMAPSTLYTVYYPARSKAGREDLRFHDLRHTGAVLAAQTGATLAELMGRLGHSTHQAALRYQHAAQGRDARIAAALSRIADASEA